MADESGGLSVAEGDDKICFDEIQFFPIASQTNVYGLTKFNESHTGYTKVLLVCLKANILSVSSSRSSRPYSLSSVNVPLKNLQG